MDALTTDRIREIHDQFMASEPPTNDYYMLVHPRWLKGNQRMDKRQLRRWRRELGIPLRRWKRIPPGDLVLKYATTWGAVAYDS